MRQGFCILRLIQNLYVMPTNTSLGREGSAPKMTKGQLYGQIALVIAIIAGIVTFTFMVI